MIFFNRIEQVADYYGFKSINIFAKEALKYASAEKLYRLKEENTSPSVEILQDIANKFEFVNMNWFITGRGEMLRNSSKNDEKCEICTVKDRLITEQDKHLKTKGELIAQLKEENEKLKENISEIKKYSGIIPVKNAAVVSAG